VKTGTKPNVIPVKTGTKPNVIPAKAGTKPKRHSRESGNPITFTISSVPPEPKNLLDLKKISILVTPNYGSELLFSPLYNLLIGKL
jgi:hypothetical protein